MFNSELAEFLAHSVELEAEARERYQELADSMDSHNNPQVSEFFQRMAMEASEHLSEVELIVGSAALPRLKPWEFNWLDAEAPESTSYEALHYRMGMREAVSLALENEHAAQRYYRHVAARSNDPETVRIATKFADEEQLHAAALERILQQLPPDAVHARLEDDEPHLPE